MDLRVKKFIAASILAIIFTAIFEFLYTHFFMLSIFNNSEHPWRYFGAIVSSITGMALFTTPIFMRSKFDEDYRYAFIMGASIAVLFTINDVLYFFVIDNNLSVAELFFWIILEFLEYTLMGLVYVYLTGLSKLEAYLKQW